MLSSATSLQAQKRYNVRKFSFYVPPGWKMTDHDVNMLYLSSTQTTFLLFIYTIAEGDAETKWERILKSLNKSLKFENELSGEGSYNIDNGLHVSYKFGDVVMRDNNQKFKFIWTQIDNDEDYTIIMYGFCDSKNFGYYRPQLYTIWDNISYKEE
jgi:hypothetical protein